jgi:hypothetical protein
LKKKAVAPQRKLFCGFAKSKAERHPSGTCFFQ